MSYDSHRSLDGKIPEGDDPLEFIKAHPPMNAHQMRADCEWLIAEIERLRAEAKDLFRSFPICSPSMQGGECSAEDRWKEVVAIVVVERDAALAECDGLLDELSRCQCERVGES